MKNELELSARSMLNRRGDFLSSFDSMFDEMVRGTFPSLSREFGIDVSKSSYPKVNVIDSDKDITIEAAVPGLSKDDVLVELLDNVLSISADKQTNNETRDKKYVCRELKRSSFSRSFSLTGDLDAEKINASFKDGLLIITIPKKEGWDLKSGVRKIEVK